MKTDIGAQIITNYFGAQMKSSINKYLHTFILIRVINLNSKCNALFMLHHLQCRK